jgi:gluconate 2-dehydrogenase gamma chain
MFPTPFALLTVRTPSATIHLAGDLSLFCTHSSRFLPSNSTIASEGGAASVRPVSLPWAPAATLRCLPVLVLTRREFIYIAAAAAAASGATSCSNAKVPWRYLSADEARTLAAMCDQIIPPDRDPGAQWAQVVNYIDIQLCGPFRELRLDYRHGIAALDRISKVQFGKAFEELGAEPQEALLKLIEQGAASDSAWSPTAQKSFFGVVLDHTMQGFYGDPRHGGNRERASWKMLELPYPPVRGQQRYGTKK